MANARNSDIQSIEYSYISVTDMNSPEAESFLRS